MSASIYIAVTGTNHYFGSEVFKIGQRLRFVKDPDNRHDQEAIQAELMPIGKVGYVANSTHTVPKGCRSGGRIYDTFDKWIEGTVRFIVDHTVIVELAEHGDMEIRGTALQGVENRGKAVEMPDGK